MVTSGCSALVDVLCCMSVKNSHRPFIHIVATHDYFNGFEASFSRFPTRDITPYCMVPHALDFIKDNLGGFSGECELHINIPWSVGTVMNNLYSCRKLWGSTGQLGSRYVVREVVPAQATHTTWYGGTLYENGANTWISPRTSHYNEHIKKLVVSLFMRYKVTSYVEVVAGELWCRLSAQVYNTHEDFLQLASAMEQLALSPP